MVNSDKRVWVLNKKEKMLSISNVGVFFPSYGRLYNSTLAWIIWPKDIQKCSVSANQIGLWKDCSFIHLNLKVSEWSLTCLWHSYLTNFGKHQNDYVRIHLKSYFSYENREAPNTKLWLFSLPVPVSFLSSHQKTVKKISLYPPNNQDK